MSRTATITRPRPLSDRITGRVVHPSDPDWDDSRRGFDLTVDLRPAAIAFPRDAREVVTVVDYAREHGLRIAPQSTGHNAGPLASLEDTILVNVRELSDVSIDPIAQRARVGAGVRWQQIVPQLSELGLAALHGSSPDVGIAGYSLGGGMGWLARRHGLQANSVTALELVTADGRMVRTDATHEPELFWALRGGGGNFGMVTAIEFTVYPVEELYAGVMFFPPERFAEVLHAWTAMMPGLPDEMMTWVSRMRFPDIPVVPDHVRGRAFVVFSGAFLGEEEAAQALLAPVRDLGPAMDTFAMVPPSELADMAMDPRDPLPYSSAHGLLSELPSSGVEALAVAVDPASGHELDLIQLRHMGGALSRPAPGAGARATLPGEVCWLAIGVEFDETMAAGVARSLRRVDDALRPHRGGHYPNFVERRADASTFFDPGTWARLRRVKADYDPDDMFTANHRVPRAEADDARV